MRGKGVKKTPAGWSHLDDPDPLFEAMVYDPLNGRRGAGVARDPQERLFGAMLGPGEYVHGVSESEPVVLDRRDIGLVMKAERDIERALQEDWGDNWQG